MKTPLLKTLPYNKTKKKLNAYEKTKIPKTIKPNTSRTEIQYSLNHIDRNMIAVCSTPESGIPESIANNNTTIFDHIFLPNALNKINKLNSTLFFNTFRSITAYNKTPSRN